MLLDDAVDEELISRNPVRRRRRGRRRDRTPSARERVWAMPDHIVRIAATATTLGGPSAGLLIITAAWTGCRWGELTGLQWHNVDLTDPGNATITIDPDIGALHESKHTLYLGPPKTPASARTIRLPRFLALLLRQHQHIASSSFVFTSPRGCLLRRSTFDRRVLRPACDGNPTTGVPAVRTGLTFHGLRHSHKTWLIADHVPEIAQARRLGHHLRNRLVETYSHVAPEVETHLLRCLEKRWQRTAHLRHSPRPRGRTGLTAPHSHPARDNTNTSKRHRPQGQVRVSRPNQPGTERTKITAPRMRQQVHPRSQLSTMVRETRSPANTVFAGQRANPKHLQLWS
ncbi:site-specific integrase [Labedaea rhizosphaerae]|uniref:site-specific integrase n=1 Tax=Labedaea rhizosphaerae TaxID=598644 RepID=UPI00105EE8F9|nr:site-specific integrase [Labedaea rhizosphaerae]